MKFFGQLASLRNAKKIEDGLDYAEKASRDLANAEQEIDAKLDERS